MATEIEFNVDQNANWSKGFRLKTKVSTNPDVFEYVDLTGATFIGQIAPSVNGGSPVTQMSFELLDQTDPDPVTGTRGAFIASLSAAQTAAFVGPTQPAGKRKDFILLFDIEITRNGTKKRYLDGKFIVSPEVK